MKNELLTVIIPYYNNPDFQIKKAIESVLNQKKIHIKILILIIDDFSKKKLELKDLNLIKYDQQIFRIKVHRVKRNQGDSAARVLGANLSKSRYIAFLDSDDYWKNIKLFEQFSFMKKYNIKIIGSNWNNKNYFFNFFKPHSKFYKISKLSMSLKWWPHISTILMDRNLFKKLNLNESRHYRYAGDGDMLIKLASSNLLYILNKSLVVCHSFKNNKYSSGMSSKMKEMKTGEIIVIKNNFDNSLLVFLFSLWINIKFLIRLFKNRIR